MSSRTRTVAPCPAVDDGPAAVILIGIYFGSAILGGVAVAASLVTRPDSLATGVYALAALVVPYVVGVIYIVNAVCGIS